MVRIPPGADDPKSLTPQQPDRHSPPSAHPTSTASSSPLRRRRSGESSRVAADLKQIGETLNAGEAGLIVVYATNMADQVAASIKADNKYVSASIDASADDIAAQIKAAEGGDS